MKKLLEYKRPALILFVVWTLVGLAFSGAGMISVVVDNRSETVWTVVSGSLSRAYVWGAMSPLIYLFAKRFRVDPRRLGFKNIAYNLIFGLFLSFLYPWIFVAYSCALDPNYLASFPSFRVFLSRQVFLLSWYTVISLYVPTFFTVQALLFFSKYQNEQAKNAALQAEVSRAQLSALKMQLHPHFLFNALHSISSLILIDPSRANKMVALLGDFLRQTLDHSNEQIVTLEEELGFLRCYLEIEETRFADRLSVHFDIDADVLGASVPHLIMQPIVENAVKHGIAPYELPGRIDISAKRAGRELLLQVTDSGPHCKEGGDSGVIPKNGVGITNVRSRLECIYGEKASISISDLPTSGCRVDLIIPFVSEEAASNGSSQKDQ